MKVSTLDVTQAQAIEAVNAYKAHRNLYDEHDKQIERIYRAISKGKTVISVYDSIVNAGTDDKGRPLLAICVADATECVAETEWNKNSQLTFGVPRYVEGSSTQIRTIHDKLYIPWVNKPHMPRCVAKLPRILPQFRPAKAELHNYHILWEANWTDIPVDPILLKRIATDAWVVLAAWDLTAVELNVLRAHR